MSIEDQPINPSHLEEDGELKLQDVDAQTPEQILDSNKDFALPLTDDERKILRSRTTRRVDLRLTLSELISLITLFCVLLAISKWMPFEFYTVGLGTTTVILLLGFFDGLLNFRYRRYLVFIFLLSYIGSAVWLIFQSR